MNMEKIETKKIRLIKELEETFIETITITSWGKAFFLGIYPRKDGVINAWLYPGTSMYEFAKENKIVGERIFINFTASPIDILKVFKHEYTEILSCSHDFCFLVSSYLIIPATIVRQEEDKDKIRLTISMDDKSYYIPGSIPITNRYTCMLTEALIHLSRMEYYCRLGVDSKVVQYWKKLYDAIEIMERVSNNHLHTQINRWIKKRAEKCMEKTMPK
jgi:hypothetical protein